MGLDLLTTVDLKAEEAILGVLKPKYLPLGHKFIAEESSSLEPMTDAPTWCVDPLDGTVNFVQRFPYSCVSIGLVVEKRCVLGVIYCPAFDELYVAVEGRGAYLNGAKMSVKPTTRLEDAMVASNISANRNAHFVDTTMACLRATLDNLGSFRSLGSAAMCMAYVARGVCDSYWELLVGGPWDFAAGAVLITEAGGVCLDCSGGEWDIMSRRVLCGVPAVCNLLGARLKRVLDAAGPYVDDSDPAAAAGERGSPPAAAGAAAGTGADGAGTGTSA